MSGALILLVVGFLPRGALCGKFEALVPQYIDVPCGSCVTIPCSFDIGDDYTEHLHEACHGIWKVGHQDKDIVFDSRMPQQSKIKGNLTGNLKRKDCTTTLNNMHPHNSDKYFFRLDCSNELKWNFADAIVNIVVRRADPPSLTLNISRQKVREGTSVIVKCSAAAPCRSHPPSLTWTPSLGDSEETTDNFLKTSVLTFTASFLHHGKSISCTAAYDEQAGRFVQSKNLTLKILCAPQIRSSSGCVKNADRVSCSCEAEGFPAPSLLWYLDGLPVNHSDEFAISHESLSDTGVRSIITANQPQERNHSTLVCRTTNSQGTTSQRFYVLNPDCQKSSECRGSYSGQVLLSVFIGTAAFLTGALVCSLLFAIRARWSLSKMGQSAGDSDPFVASQILTSGSGNEVPNRAEEDIYMNTKVLQGSHPRPERTSEASGPNLPSTNEPESKNEEDPAVLYSSVIWKRKTKKMRGEEDCGHPSGSSYLEEERCMVGGVNRNVMINALPVDCLYAQVKFKDRNVERK